MRHTPQIELAVRPGTDHQPRRQIGEREGRPDCEAKAGRSVRAWFRRGLARDRLGRLLGRFEEGGDLLPQLVLDVIDRRRASSVRKWNSSAIELYSRSSLFW